MLKSIEQILKESGQTDEQITAILATLGPAKNIFETTLRTAEETLATATKKETEINRFWNEEAAPQINQAFSEKATAEAQASFYRTQAEEARKNGFIAKDAPGYTPPANPNPNPNPAPGPTVVANKNEVPGSPAYMTVDQGARAISEAAFLLTEHQRLFNEPLPDLSELMESAGQSRRKARDIWSEKYKVSERRATLEAEKKAAERATMEKEITAKVAKDFAEKYGHDGTRPMAPSRYPNYARDEKTGAPDKLAWTRADKKERLRKRIYDQVAKDQGRTAAIN